VINFYLLFVVFVISLSTAFLLIRAASKIDWLIHDLDTKGVQKLHVDPTPSIGGVSVFLAFSSGLWIMDNEPGVLALLWLSSLPVFIAGLVEDITLKISPTQRLFFAFISILLSYMWLDISINSLGFRWVDDILIGYPFYALLFTLLAVGGAVNSFNIIDGFNGLLGGYSILTSLAIAYVSYILGDDLIMQLSLTLAVSVFGFFILNFPFGKIFMGDGGAYFTGFIMSIIGLMLGIRNEEVTHWFILLLFIYPLYETVFSIYRRKIAHDTDITQPDAGHLHSVVYLGLISCNRFKHNKTICNSAVSPFIWLLSLTSIIPAIIWFDNQMFLIIWSFVFMFMYTIIYKYISSGKFNL